MKSKKITFIVIILFALFFLFSKETLAGCTSETTKEYNAYTNNLFWAILPLFVLVLFFINNIFMLMVARHYRVSLEKKRLFVYLATVVLVSTFSFSLFFVGYPLSQIGTMIKPSSLFPFPLSSILITFDPAMRLENRLSSAGIIPPIFDHLFTLINPPVLFTLMVTCITSLVLLKKMFKAEKHLIKIAVLNSLLLHPLFITTILQVLTLALALLSFSLFPFQGTKYTGNCF